MKTLLIIILSGGFLSMSTSAIEKNRTEMQQQYQVRGYIIYQNNFTEIYLTLSKTQFGYQCTKWELRQPIDHRLPSKGASNSNLIPLNAQNDYAVKYNFTHYVNIGQYGYAYLNTNEIR